MRVIMSSTVIVTRISTISAVRLVWPSEEHTVPSRTLPTAPATTRLTTVPSITFPASATHQENWAVTAVVVGSTVTMDIATIPISVAMVTS